MGAGPRGLEDDGREHGQAAFHVQRTAPPQLAVDHGCGEGVVSPAVRGGGYHVGMAVEQQGRGFPASRDARDEVGTVAVAREDARLKARRAQLVGQQGDAFALAPRRF